MKTIDDETEFQPFMLQRWASMYSSDIAKIIGLTTNKLYSVYQDKPMWYKTFLVILPKCKKSRIKYIRKVKEDSTVKEENTEKIEMLARSYNLSKREVEIYIKEFNISLDSIKTNRRK